MEAVNSTVIHCKNFGKCHNVSPKLQGRKGEKNDLDRI
jgi:hypothetical protein